MDGPAPEDTISASKKSAVVLTVLTKQLLILVVSPHKTGTAIGDVFGEVRRYHRLKLFRSGSIELAHLLTELINTLSDEKLITFKKNYVPKGIATQPTSGGEYCSG